jgi:hypothetical protein
MLRSPKAVQLLQQPLPAQPTAAQRAVLASCSSSLQQLSIALSENPSTDSARSASVQLLQCVLCHQPVHSAGTLLVWLQQQQQLTTALLSCSVHQLQASTMEGLWFAALQLVSTLAVLLHSCSTARESSCTAAAAQLMVDTTQQLLQSGECVAAAATPLSFKRPYRVC